MKRIRGSFQAIAVCAALLMVAGTVISCARKPRREPTKVKVAVLDMHVAQEGKAPKEIEGWWFGARDVYYNPNAGRLFATILAKRLSQLPYVDVHPRVEYKYYVARKIERLKKSFPDLTDDEAATLFEQSSPVDIGKELRLFWGVDKVLSGRIISGSTIHNRTFHWWRSSLEVEIALVDVQTGATEWRVAVQKTKNLRSEYRTMELAADEVVRRLAREYFLKPR